LQARPPAKPRPPRKRERCGQEGEAAWGTSGQVTRISRKGTEVGTQNQKLDNRKRTMNEKLGFRFRSTWDIIEAAEKGYQLKIEE